MDSIASQITNLTIVYSTVHSGAEQRKHQSSASLAFVWEIHRWPVNFPHKWPVTRKMFPFDDVIMKYFDRHSFAAVLNLKSNRTCLYRWLDRGTGARARGGSAIVYTECKLCENERTRNTNENANCSLLVVLHNEAQKLIQLAQLFHDVTFLELLALCEGNPPVPVGTFTKGQYYELWCFCGEQTVKQTLQRPDIWDAMALIWPKNKCISMTMCGEAEQTICSLIGST